MHPRQSARAAEPFTFAFREHTDKQRSHLKIGNKLPDGDYLRLEVSDTGCGITEEQRTRIFDPFLDESKGKRTRAGCRKGNSSVSRGCDQRNQRPGRGTTFEIFFPCFEQNSMMTVCAGCPAHSVNGLPRSKHRTRRQKDSVNGAGSGGRELSDAVNSGKAVLKAVRSSYSFSRNTVLAHSIRQGLATDFQLTRSLGLVPVAFSKYLQDQIAFDSFKGCATPGKDRLR